MRLTDRTRRWARAVHGLSALLLVAIVGLGAWLSERHNARFDLTASGRNSLSAASTELLGSLEEDTRMTVFAREDRIEGRVVGELVGRYRSARPDLGIEFVNPDVNPERMRELGVTRPGTVEVSYGPRSRLVERPSERTLSNALLQLLRQKSPMIAGLEGHGERALGGKANHDLGRFGAALEAKGFKHVALNVASAGAVPSNANLLLIASPLVDLLEQEAAAIETFVDNGGNLLWLMDPGSLRGLDGLAARLGVARIEGTLLDPAAQQFARLGVGNATYVLVSRYGEHPAISGFKLLTVFPGASALEHQQGNDFNAAPLLLSSANVWAERGPLGGSVRYDEQTERRGPFALGYVLTRKHGERTQRIVIIGDGDFLSNAALGNSGNLDLGLRLVEWLAGSDELLQIPARTDPDSSLQLDNTVAAIMGVGYLLALPIVLFGIATGVWLKRRNR